MKKIGIIFNDMGNISSVENAFNFLQIDVVVSDSISKLEKMDAFILPGVGAYPQAVNNLNNKGFNEFLEKQVIVRQKPILGICLGMQLFGTSSEEQKYTEGLGWIDGTVKQIDNKPGFAVPHVGWNNLVINSDLCLFRNLEEDCNYYFDHSYEFFPENNENVLASCNYSHNIVSAIRKENIFGVQFHPEKSQRNGLKILRNFSNIVQET